MPASNEAPTKWPTDYNRKHVNKRHALMHTEKYHLKAITKMTSEEELAMQISGMPR